MDRQDMLQLLAAHPRAALGHFPTPLQSFSRLLVKRDDLTDLAMGGNKVRKLEFFVGEALAQDARTLVTLGSLQSNHCCLTAAAAARYGLACRLLMVGQPEEGHRLEGNRLLSALLGAEMFYIDPASARQQIDDHLDDLRRDGVPFYFIPGGGHSPTGLLGYLAASLELTAQLDELGVSPTRLFVTCGTGTTQAGLLLGLRLLGWPLRVTGVSVARSAKRCRNEIRTVIAEFCERHMLDNPVTESDIEVDEHWIGAGYDAVPPERWGVITAVAQRYALLLDPIYTGRAMQAVFDHLTQEDSGEVIFVHTGGLPGLFVSRLQEEMVMA